MATHSDEEALDTLLGVGSEPTRPALTRSHRLCGALLALAAIGLAAVTWRGKGASTVNLDFETKVEVEVAAALEPQLAIVREARRQRLVVEQDLKLLPLAGRFSRGQARYAPKGSCSQRAEQLFDDIMQENSLQAELSQEEMLAFKARFAVAMKTSCKDVINEETWLQVAGTELEQQKPLMTEAVAVSINNAGLGFRVKMHDWLKHESVATFHAHLGLLPKPHGQKSVFKRKADVRQAVVHFPKAFRAELKWPKCKEEILRIHNQGHCGSCWAFGGLASIDARMCIATDGNWNAPEEILSRLHVLSCAPDNYWQGHDGCQGGFPHWPMEMMAKAGVSSSSCLPYYISGEGVEHFEHQDVAPPCPAHCQGGYSLPLVNDTYSSVGVADYDWLTDVHGDPEKIRITKTAIYQEGPVAFAFYANHAFMGYQSGVFSVCTGHDQANHAVYAFGWGVAPQADGGEAVEYLEASNSWGVDWGAGGHFRIHPRCVTDVTIPGTIESSVVSHKVGTVDPDVPRDPENPAWPWPKPDECPYVDGCVTDVEFPQPYDNNEVCVSHKLDGKKIKVIEFETERGYDVLIVSGRRLSGKDGAGFNASLVNGLEVDSAGIRFESDFSVNAGGFKICEE